MRMIGPLNFIKMIVIVSSLSIVLSGCAHYGLSSEAKSTIVDEISPNTITVTFCGNAYMSQEEVEKYTLQRASLEALSRECSHFIIVNKEDKSKICALPSAGKRHLYDAQPVEDPKPLIPSHFVEPNMTLTIQCLFRGEKIPENAINAEEFLDENFPSLRE